MTTTRDTTREWRRIVESLPAAERKALIDVGANYLALKGAGLGSWGELAWKIGRLLVEKEVRRGGE